MEIILYLYFTLAFISSVFIFAGFIIESSLKETHPIMKWWRKHIVGLKSEDDN